MLFSIYLIFWVFKSCFHIPYFFPEKKVIPTFISNLLSPETGLLFHTFMVFYVKNRHIKKTGLLLISHSLTNSRQSGSRDFNFVEDSSRRGGSIFYCLFVESSLLTTSQSFSSVTLRPKNFFLICLFSGYM